MKKVQKLPIIIGNWLIDNDAIRWNGKPCESYEIERSRMLEAGPGDRKNKYDWLVHLAEKNWLSKEDIYSLNTAFILALELYKIPIPQNLSFIDTFIEQESILKQK